MPSLMLRNLSADLVARVRAYARGRGLSLPDAASDLLTAGLERRQSQQAGAIALNAQTTPEDRSASARTAARARWDRVTTPAPDEA